MRYVPRRRGQKKHKQPLPVWQETLLLLGTAVVMALIIKTFFLQAFYIPSGSMRQTLEVNDRILVQKVSYWFGDVERGDVVVFDDPANWLAQEDARTADNLLTSGLAKIGLYPTGGHLVKRVIGVGGDTVQCEGGQVLVNGAALEESSYVTLPDQACAGAWGPIEVPDEHIWVMGDNRNQSADSRVHLGDPGGGSIPVDDVVGKVFVVVWPISRWDFIGRPDSFDSVPEAAGLVTTVAPVGLALMLGLPIYRRRKESRTHERRGFLQGRRRSGGPADR
jgi:signal peptidase I